MKKYIHLPIIESLSELKTLRKKTANHRLKTRIQCLILIKEKTFKYRKDIAFHLGISVSSLTRWISKYRKSGINSFLSIDSGGQRVTVVSKDLHKALSDKLHDSNNPLMGYTDAVEWIKKEHKVEINYKTLWAYIRRNFDAKLKVPRKSHYKKDEKAVEAFKKTSGVAKRY